MPGDSIDTDIIEIGPGKCAEYKISFCPTEFKKYSGKSQFVINDGSQNMTVYYYGYGEKPGIGLNGSDEGLIDFGNVFEGIESRGSLTLVNLSLKNYLFLFHLLTGIMCIDNSLILVRVL